MTADLGFPDLPRLDLDELLVQLVDRAGDVQATQGRLRGLLRANALIAGDLSLPAVLRQIVRAARDLLGARYAVLGVLGSDGRLEQFVHDGLDDELAARIGALPSEHGILDLLVSDRVPPGQGFVRVPVRIGEEIVGNLYLAERITDGEFTADDEELAIALATAAGAAIANARRFAESEQRRRWLDASARLTPLLLAGNTERPYTLIAEHAAAAVDADFALLAVAGEPDQTIVAGVSGPLAAGLPDRTAPLADSLTGEAIRTGQGDLITGSRLAAAAAVLGADLGPLMVVPLAAGEQILGALLLGRRAARPGFTASDLAMAVSFAGHTAVAMELLRTRADQILLAQAEDHDRIAGDLHDQVISELFALGLRLLGHAARSDPVTAKLVSGYADTVDDIIGNIRSSIFGLRQPRQAAVGLRAQVMTVVEEHAPRLGFTASSSFSGLSFPGPDAALSHDIVAVTREALSNCARHAHATAVTVALAAGDELITLDITDNGRGLGSPARSSGLASMRRRAESNGGTLRLSVPAGGGTRLTWTARTERS
jgi:signal transduction histidine kinase